MGKQTIVEYDAKMVYQESRMPNACFGHGDRTAYILSTDGIEKLNKKFKVNLWSEYDATLNVFTDGTVNLMKMHYNSYDEEFQEEELYVLTDAEFAELKLQEA